MKSFIDLYYTVQDMTPTRLLWWTEVESDVPYFESENCVKCLIARYLASVVGEEICVGSVEVRLASDIGVDWVKLPSWVTTLIFHFDVEYAGDVPRQEAVKFLKDWLLPERSK